MGQTRSNYEWNRVESLAEQCRIMIRTGSNHEPNKFESWVEQGPIISRLRPNHGSSRVEISVKYGQIMGRTRSNYEPGSVICFSFKSNLLNVQHIPLDWKTNPKINIGSVKSLAWACSKVWSYPGWVVRLDFRRKLRWSSEYYSRTKSNHGSNRVESWVKQGRIISRTGSNHESNIVVSLVEQGRIKSQTRSNHGSNKFELWVEQGHLLQLHINFIKRSTYFTWLKH